MTELICLAHGSGSGLSQRLLRDVFLRHLNDPELARMADSAVLVPPEELCHGDRVAFTTDSYVISPLEFPGGDIGKLAVCGTINDLAAVGARPLWLSAGWVLEEGLPIEVLERLVTSMAKTAAQAGVRLVTGDTKVVPHGLADGVYVNTAGVGLVPAGRYLGVEQITEGDAILVSGTLGDHGMAVMMVRQGISMSSELKSDCTPLHSLVEALFAAGVRVHCLRDATRGGVAGILCELAEASHRGIELDEVKLPFRPEVAAACEMLGLDPLFVANEGKMVALVAATDAERALSTWRASDQGREAALIGRVTAYHPGQVVIRTRLGTGRLIRMPMGELLPRIC
ncbi:MAG: hydrogenase expression/formation protein HypE [Anaerolineae bacterium]